jgi:hypothetical protein
MEAIIAIATVSVAAIGALAVVAHRLAVENSRLFAQLSASVDVSLRLLASKDYAHFRLVEDGSERLREKRVPRDGLAQTQALERELELSRQAVAEADPYGIGA